MASKAVVADRVAEVYKLLVSGKANFEVVKFCKSNFGVAETQARRYITKAWELIEDDSVKDRKRQRNIALARYSRIFSLAMMGVPTGRYITQDVFNDKGEVIKKKVAVKAIDLKQAISAQDHIDRINFLHIAMPKDLRETEEQDEEIDFSNLTDEELALYIQLQRKALGNGED